MICVGTYSCSLTIAYFPIKKMRGYFATSLLAGETKGRGEADEGCECEKERKKRGRRMEMKEKGQAGRDKLFAEKKRKWLRRRELRLVCLYQFIAINCIFL